MTSTTERAEPMRGLADFLRFESNRMDKSWPQIHELRRWASEVESLQLPAKAVVTDERAEFEKWWGSLNLVPYYTGIEKRIAFNAWRARAVLQASTEGTTK